MVKKYGQTSRVKNAVVFKFALHKSLMHVAPEQIDIGHFGRMIALVRGYPKSSLRLCKK